MLANTHRRHLVSNRLALAIGLVLLLAQTGQWTSGDTQDGVQENDKVVVADVNNDSSGKPSYNILLDLGLLLLSR